jgi:hypothetical protein
MFELEPRSEPHEVCRKDWKEGEGRGRKGTNLTVSFLFLPSVCGPHTGLSHQGLRPKTVEATVTPWSRNSFHNLAVRQLVRKFVFYDYRISITMFTGQRPGKLNSAHTPLISSVGHEVCPWVVHHLLQWRITQGHSSVLTERAILWYYTVSAKLRNQITLSSSACASETLPSPVEKKYKPAAIVRWFSSSTKPL